MHETPLNNKFFPLLILWALGVFVGCSSYVPTAAEMVSSEINVSQHHPHSLVVRVEGGGVEGSSYISNLEFKKAIEQSILDAKVFSSISQGTKANYQLDAFLGDVKFPTFGATMVAQLEVVWNLSKIESGKTVWQEVVRTSSSASGDDAISGHTRATIATVRAAKENVQKGVQLLSHLSL